MLTATVNDKLNTPLPEAASIPRKPAPRAGSTACCLAGWFLRLGDGSQLISGRWRDAGRDAWLAGVLEQPFAGSRLARPVGRW